MNDLNRRAFRGLLRMALFLAVSVFLPALIVISSILLWRWYQASQQCCAETT